VVEKMIKHKAEFGEDKIYANKMGILHEELNRSAKDLRFALLVSYV
jgi:hypothetical protein